MELNFYALLRNINIDKIVEVKLAMKAYPVHEIILYTLRFNNDASLEEMVGLMQLEISSMCVMQLNVYSF